MMTSLIENTWLYRCNFSLKQQIINFVFYFIATLYFWCLLRYFNNNEFNLWGVLYVKNFLTPVIPILICLSYFTYKRFLSYIFLLEKFCSGIPSSLFFAACFFFLLCSFIDLYILYIRVSTHLYNIHYVIFEYA